MRPDELDPLPPGTRLVHIGHPKSGSTALQAALVRERAQLRELGVLYPGSGLRSAEAGWAALGIGSPVGRRPPRIKAWHALTNEVAAAAQDRVCISNEDFARADRAAVRTIVEGLGGDRVHVVLVARRLDRQLPSQWQERVKASRAIPFRRWITKVLDDETGWFEANNPWLTDLGGLIGRWVDVVGPDRFTLVVGDERDHTVTPRTFERLLDLPSGMLVSEPTRDNRSLSFNEVELVRRLNQQLAPTELPDELYRQLVQRGMVGSIKSSPPRADDVAIPQIPESARARVVELSAQRVGQIQESGVRVVGDPSNLLVPELPPDDITPPPHEISIEVAARAISGILAAVEQREARTQRIAERKARAAEQAVVREPPSPATVLADAGGRELVRELGSRLRARVTRS